MLQFWRKDKHKSPNTSPQKIHNGNIQTSLIDLESVASVGPLSHFKHDINPIQSRDAKSRLTLSLEDIFHNKIALSYFSQYMEGHGNGNLFNLLMEVENISFKLPSVLPKRTHSLSSSPLKTPPFSNTDVSGIKSKNLHEPNVSPKKIFTQYLSEDAPNRVRLPEDLKCEIYSACASESFDFRFDKLKEHIHQVIKKDLWLDFLRSDWYCKYQIEIMTSGKMTLYDVLYNDACLLGFIEFLKLEGCASVIEFWQEAMKFQLQYSLKRGSLDSEMIQTDAMIIYDKYISLQATTPLGINDEVRFAVEQGICGEAEETDPNCLMPAICLIEAFLRTSCLRLFLSSHQYVSLLSDVMSSTKPHSSPASSITDGSVDTRPPPSEPDLLWRRRKQNSGLSFGRVDELGRYETDIEPEPERKSESRISRVVKLILSKDEQKTQEEMAWRVAEMIVKDITSITMGNPQNDEML